MNSDVTNLRKFKKKKLREQKQQLAEANRVKFGRTKDQKTNHMREETRSCNEHSGKKLENSIQKKTHRENSDPLD